MGYDLKGYIFVVGVIIMYLLLGVCLKYKKIMVKLLL